MNNAHEEIISGSGNVYKDLNYANAQSMKVKAELVHRLSILMQNKNLTQNYVADKTGIPQPRLSKILRGQFREVSEYKLLECLARLGNDVNITITESTINEGNINLVFA